MLIPTRAKTVVVSIRFIALFAHKQVEGLFLIVQEPIVRRLAKKEASINTRSIYGYYLNMFASYCTYHVVASGVENLFKSRDIFVMTQSQEYDTWMSLK